MKEMLILIIVILLIYTYRITKQNEYLKHDVEMMEWQAQEFSDILTKHKIFHGWG